ncbi:MAG: hypothetical protein EBU66_11335 [Bacteroidetes bacterium]|nr:hypothetical protein [bacterium]NBP65233.1 hypothetical protein [Bacteroidota bacterium]
MKISKGYSLPCLLAVLFLAVAFLPVIRRTFARSFPEGFQATGGVDSRKGDCKGVTCNEGEFCQENVCRPVMAPITNNYFPEK